MNESKGLKNLLKEKLSQGITVLKSITQDEWKNLYQFLKQKLSTRPSGTKGTKVPDKSPPDEGPPDESPKEKPPGERYT